MTLTDSKPRSAALNPLAIIDRIIADIELTPAQYKEAKTSYEAIAYVLSKPDSPIQFLNTEIFPQGSMRLGTTVRPIGNDHFDLDMVCWVGASGKICTPEEVYEWVWNALGSDETYRHMRQRKNRCIRLDYAESRKFHLDVTPAVPDWVQQSRSLYVPDRELKVWCPSHPIGFADDWFKKAAEKLPTFQAPFLANTRRHEVFASASIEPLEEFGGFEKKPLQRIVQLVKRDRDNYFQDDVEHRPTSILLTTITTHAYLDTARIPVGGLLNFVAGVLGKLPQYIKVSGTQGSPVFAVLNPAHPSENFAEKWTGEHYIRFKRWHSKLVAWLQGLMESRGLGADVMLNRLSTSFGNERVIRAANALGVDTHALHEVGRLRVAKDIGQVGAVGALIPATTFFGNAS